MLLLTDIPVQGLALLHTEHAQTGVPYPHFFEASRRSLFGKNQILPCSVSSGGLATNCPAVALLFLDGIAAIAKPWNEFAGSEIRTERRTKLLRDVMLSVAALKQRPGWALLSRHGVGWARPDFESLVAAYFTEMVSDGRRSRAATEDVVVLAFEAASLFKKANNTASHKVCLDRALVLGAKMLANCSKVPWSVGTEMSDMQHKAMCLSLALQHLPQASPEYKECEIAFRSGYQYEFLPVHLNASDALQEWASQRFSRTAEHFLKHRKLPGC